MTALILHHYDASPFTQKALRMLGLKQLEWSSVLTPMMPPKDDLVILTGGYRGTPVLQIGADIYVDSQLIADELERRHPTPTLFPAGNTGLDFLLAKWSEAFFRSCLAIAVEQTAAKWPEPFLKDRKHLFPDFDFASAMTGSTHARTQFRAHAGRLDQQLADGRVFLSGAAAGLVDIQAAAFVWMARNYFPDVAAALLEPFQRLPPWEARVTALGEGTRRECDAATALEVARSSALDPTGAVALDDATGLQLGQWIEVAPDDTRRGASRGRLVSLQWDRLAISRQHPACGTVHVHFPRLGYRAMPLSDDRIAS
jgi:glutathione S-transferase